MGGVRFWLIGLGYEEDVVNLFWGGSDIVGYF